MKNILTTIFVLSIATNLYSAQRPLSGMKLDKVDRICESWAKSSDAKLLVAFEGLGAYREKAALKLYKYQDLLVKNGDAVEPKNGSMAYVTENILKKNLTKTYDRTEVLVLPHSKEGKQKSVSYRCVKAWHKVHKEELSLVILGHSFGGNAAKRLMNTLNERIPNFKVKAMLSLDPRLKSKFITKSNIKKHYVYYQKGFLRGYPYKDERGDGFTKNIVVPGKLISGPEGNNHANLTLYSEVQKTYLSLILD